MDTFTTECLIFNTLRFNARLCLYCFAIYLVIFSMFSGTKAIESSANHVEDPFTEVLLYRDLIPHKGDAKFWFEGLDKEMFKRKLSNELGEFTPLTPPLETYRKILFLWKTFAKLCDRYGITYFLYAGSMVGAYRHHGIIPWERDIEVLINNSHAEKARRAFKAQPGFILQVRTNDTWSFFQIPANFSKQYVKVGTHWPIININVFVENQTHLWNEANKLETNVYLKLDVLPLQRRPFLDGLYPVPCNMAGLIENAHSPSKCESPSKGLDGETLLTISVDCYLLEEFFPFVKRGYIRRGLMYEELVLNGTVLHSMFVENFC